MTNLHVDSTVEIDPAKQTWQTNSLRFPSKARGGARASIAIQPMPQGKIFSAAWKGKVGVRIEPGCGMYSLRFMTGGNFRYSDGRNIFCSEPDLFIPPDQPFGGSFQDIRLLFVDLSPAVMERALGAAPACSLGIRTLPANQGKKLRVLAFRSVRKAEGLSTALRGPFLRNFQNLMASHLSVILREMLPDVRRPDPMIGRRKVADLCEWAALDHEDPVTVGDLAARCGLGLRALQKNFLRHFDSTPGEYLRGLRLDQARKLILSGAFTVTHAALEAGFVHLGHFSANYEKRFGELPSVTAACVARERA